MNPNSVKTGSSSYCLLLTRTDQNPGSVHFSYSANSIVNTGDRRRHQWSLDSYSAVNAIVSINYWIVK